MAWQPDQADCMLPGWRQQQRGDHMPLELDCPSLHYTLVVALMPLGAHRTLMHLPYCAARHRREPLMKRYCDDLWNNHSGTAVAQVDHTSVIARLRTAGVLFSRPARHIDLLGHLDRQRMGCCTCQWHPPMAALTRPIVVHHAVSGPPWQQVESVRFHYQQLHRQSLVRNCHLTMMTLN